MLKDVLTQGHEVVGRGTEAVVVAGPGDHQVTKLYVGHAADNALRAAEREFEILHLLSFPRASIMRTPRPVCVCREGHVGIIMERCSGVSLLEYITSDSWDEDSVANIARWILDFIFDYVAICGEHYRDIEPGNILYDPGTKILTAIDFSIGRCMKPEIVSGDSLVAVSVAEFISGLIFSTLQPKALLDATLRTRSISLYNSLLLDYASRFQADDEANKLWRLAKRALLIRFGSLDFARRYWFEMRWKATCKYWKLPI